MLGSAGLLVTGGGLMAASSPIGSARSAVVAAPSSAITPDAEQKWAQQARVTLASLDTQLEEVTKTEQSWNTLPPAQRPDPAPAAVRALSTRKALLQQQRTTVASELATWQSARDAGRRLADTERHVASLDRAIDQVPKHRQLSSAESNTAQQLNEQRSMRARQRDSQRQELTNLRQGLREAIASPLPRDDGSTKALTARVTEMIKNPSKRHTRDHEPLTDQPPRPEVIAPRERADQSRKDVGNGAPPNPGRSRPEIPGAPDILAAPKQQRSDLGGLLGGVTREAPRVGNAPSGQSGRPEAGQRGGLGGTVNDIGKAVPGVGNQPNSGTQPSRPGTGQPNGGQRGGLGGAANDIGKAVPGVGNQANRPGGAAGSPGRSNGRAGADQSDSLGSVLASPAKPLENARPADSVGNGTPSSGRRRGGAIDEPVTRPVDRVSKASFIGPSSSDLEPRSDSDTSRRSAPAPRSQSPSHLLPRDSAVSGGGSGRYNEEQKSKDAARITRAMSDGDMGDVVSAAMKANANKQAAKHSGSSSSSRSSRKEDEVDRRLREAGVEGGGSSGGEDEVDRRLREAGVEGGGSSGGSGGSSKKSSRRDRGSSGGSSGYSDKDIDRIIDSSLSKHSGSSNKHDSGGKKSKSKNDKSSDSGSGSSSMSHFAKQVAKKYAGGGSGHEKSSKSKFKESKKSNKKSSGKSKSKGKSKGKSPSFGGFSF